MIKHNKHSFISLPFQTHIPKDSSLIMSTPSLRSSSALLSMWSASCLPSILRFYYFFLVSFTPASKILISLKPLNE